MITDVHTHHANRAEAIISANACDFNPAEGCYYSVGIHPWDIEKYDIDDTFKKVTEIAETHKQVVAIGESGIDTLITTSVDKQIEVLRRHIMLSESVQKPLILHCVRSSNHIIRLHRELRPRMPWIIHGFRSNVNVLNAFLAEPNIYISIGERFNENAVKMIPDDRILIETDESALPIYDICQRIANARQQTSISLLNLTTSNTTRLFPPHQ